MSGRGRQRLFRIVVVVGLLGAFLWLLPWAIVTTTRGSFEACFGELGYRTAHADPCSDLGSWLWLPSLVPWHKGRADQLAAQIDLQAGRAQIDWFTVFEPQADARRLALERYLSGVWASRDRRADIVRAISSGAHRSVAEWVVTQTGVGMTTTQRNQTAWGLFQAPGESVDSGWNLLSALARQRPEADQHGWDALSRASWLCLMDDAGRTTDLLRGVALTAQPTWLPLLITAWACDIRFDDDLEPLASVRFEVVLTPEHGGGEAIFGITEYDPWLPAIQLVTEPEQSRGEMTRMLIPYQYDPGMIQALLVRYDREATLARVELGSMHVSAPRLFQGSSTNWGTLLASHAPFHEYRFSILSPSLLIEEAEGLAAASGLSDTSPAARVRFAAMGFMMAGRAAMEFARRGQTEAALAALERADQLIYTARAPSNPDSIALMPVSRLDYWAVERGVLLWASGETEAALETLLYITRRNVLDTRDQIEALLNLSQVQVSAGRLEDARNTALSLQALLVDQTAFRGVPDPWLTAMLEATSWQLAALSVALNMPWDDINRLDSVDSELPSVVGLRLVSWILRHHDASLSERFSQAPPGFSGNLPLLALPAAVYLIGSLAPETGDVDVFLDRMLASQMGGGGRELLWARAEAASWRRDESAERLWRYRSAVFNALIDGPRSAILMEVAGY